MFEAEIKYVATGPIAPPGERLPDAVYHDSYFDTPDGAFYASGRELRLRTADGRTVLTGKLPPFEAATASKEEHETTVTDPEAMREMLAVLGFAPKVAFSKRCRRSRTVFSDLSLEITEVAVDFSPDIFVEIEHQAATRDAALAALPVIRAFAATIGLARECPVAYTDLALTAACHGGPEPATEGVPIP